jgi:hypothetical protein
MNRGRSVKREKIKEKVRKIGGRGDGRKVERYSRRKIYEEEKKEVSEEGTEM